MTMETTVVAVCPIHCRYPLECAWTGFHDLESGIDHYILSAGYSRGSGELISDKVVPIRVSKVHLPALSTYSSIFHPLSFVRVYCTVTAVNNAGWSSTAYSQPLYIDRISKLVFNGSGEIFTNLLLASRLSWEVGNVTATPLVHWEVVPVGPAHPPAPVGSVHSSNGVFSQLDFADGVSYHTLITVCAPSGICSYASSEAVLLDSSPPIDGYFAVDTPSSANVSRSVPGSMTWRNTPRGVLRLAWVGFSDPHSGVGEVRVTVGSTYLGEDLSGGPQLIGSGGEGQGEVQLVRRLTTGEDLFVTLWAVNNAGLSSKRVIGRFLVQQDTPTNGSLVLVRSHDCQLTSCMGHCPCSARGERCLIDPATAASCRELSGRAVNVSIVLDVDPLWDTPEVYTGNGNLLRANWELASTSVWWTEWTVVPPNQIPSSWYPSDSSNTAVYLPPAAQLYHGSRHQFLVRMWFSFSEFSLSYSPVVTVDLVGPTTVGRRVTEGGVSDMDFVSSTWVWVVWSGVFAPGVPGQELRFEVKLGTTPGGEQSAVCMA